MDTEYTYWINTIDCGICHKEVFPDERHPITSYFVNEKKSKTWMSYLHGDCVAQPVVGGKPDLMVLHRDSRTYIARQLKKLPKLQKEIDNIKQLSLFEGSEG